MEVNLATQKEVAKLAGVSQATVSLVLNVSSNSGLPEETAAKVNHAVSLLGYTANRLAQALRTKRTRTIACLIPDITNPFYPALVRGVRMTAEENSYDVITVNTDGLRARELHFLRLAQQGRVDGFIGSFFGLTAEDFKRFGTHNIPIVRLENSINMNIDLPVDDVFADNFSAIKDITEFLIKKGHSKIAIISGVGGPQQTRVSGYKAAISAAELTPMIKIVDGFNEAGGMSAVNALFEKAIKPTAIVATNDLMAIGALRSLKNLGLLVPQDIAVVGFDNIPAAAQVHPPLTTIDRFQQNLGGIAARLLLERLDGKNNGPSRAIEGKYQIIERESA